MEDFSQSRGDDDLFDDEIVPIDDPPALQEVTRTTEQLSLDSRSTHSHSQPQVQPESAAPSPQVTHSSLPETRGRGRGRGLPRGTSRGGPARHQPTDRDAAPRSSLHKSKWSSQPTQRTERAVASIERTEPTKSNIPEGPDSTINPTASATDENTAPENAPSGPSSSNAPGARSRLLAVRGDRSSTGGFSKPKLTEEELTAKLTAAKQRSQDVAAAHARAQADADEFAERERAAGERRRREEGERRKMEGERERNRARKLGGREGREWDRGKEENANGRGGFAARPLRNDTESDADLSMYEWHEDRGRGRGGRGARGGGGGPRGRGRGGRGGAAVNGTQHQQREVNVSAVDEFPSLPGKPTQNNSGPASSKMAAARPQAPPRLESDTATKGKTWAEQMDD